jgi:LysR family carnitine catabolism transcriptional activator
MRYSLSSLRVFAVVAETGSLVEAAERLGRTPSTISMALKALEEEVGVPLFETERKNRLTRTGSFIQMHARDVLQHYERAVASIKAFAGNQTGRVDLACVPSVAISILPEVMLRFREAYPGVEIDVHDADSPTVVEAVAAGKVGLGVASLARPRPEIRFDTLFEDALGVVCRSDDELASAASLSWKDLAGRTFLGNGIFGWPGDAGTRDVARGAPIVVHNVLSLLALVRAGLGITVLPRLSIPATEDEMRFVPLDDPAAHRAVGLITRVNERGSPATEAFVRELRESLASRARELAITVPD